MKNLVILAHPIEESFNTGLANRIIEKLKSKGDEVVLKDLYKMDFNPTLKADEMSEIRQGHLREDIKEEQSVIKDCDNLIIIYPLWWTSMPAILKGYIDRVFSYGFAYAFNEEGGVDPLLKGKNVTLITTHGTPNKIYDESGMTEALKNTIDTGIFDFCGINVKEHIYLGEIPYVSREEGEEIIEKISSQI